MPELPEVETVRRALKSAIVGEKIVKATCLFPKIIQGDVQQFTQQVENEKIVSVNRRAKYLIIHLEHGYIVSHLRMTGKYFVTDTPEHYSKHVHCLFAFESGRTLQYEDVRKFGRLEYVAKGELEHFFIKKKLGVEPTEKTFDYNVFKEQLKQCKQGIKAVLLGQKMVVGLGNIYADEVLYKSGILPTRQACTLTAFETKQLHRHILTTLAQAIEQGGTTIRDYTSLGEQGKFQSQLGVYGQQGKPCQQCGETIQKMIVAQRGTHYCPNCQK